MIRYDLAALIEIYKISVDEYRFVVQLGWDRTKYYLVFNTAVFSAGTGLLSLEGPREVYMLTALVFVLGTFTCIIGVKAIQTGHNKYYRKAIYKKTLIEDILGLGFRLEGYPYPDANLSLGTTEGQAARQEILQDTANWLARPLRKTSVVSLATGLLRVLAAVDFAGAVLGLFRFFESPSLLDDLFVTVRSHLVLL